MRTRKILSLVLACPPGLVLTAAFARAQKASHPAFKVKLDFNRWHDTNELYADMKRLQTTFPKFLKLESIGKRFRGRDIMLMTVNNPATGPEAGKAAMYIEANIHGNEIQGGEVCLYTIWYLMENYGRVDDVTRLADEPGFYIAPAAAAIASAGPIPSSSSPCPSARRATGSCSARRASTTTATAWSTRTVPA